MTTLSDMAAFQKLAEPLYSFEPRPDQPELFDEQTGYVESRAKISILLGGNSAGKTVSSAHKATRLMLWQQPPPRRDTPFLCVSDTYEQTIKICWEEKLSKIIPHDCINWDGIEWWNRNLNQPRSVPLVDWPNRPGKNWRIEFTSADKGRRHFQGRAYGGFWFSEQFDWGIFKEVLRGCRETWYDGAHFAELTPVDPDLAYQLEQMYDDPPKSWKFFRLNAECNTTVPQDWRDSFFATIGIEELETRKTGAFSSFEGQIYKSWNPAIHALDSDGWRKFWGFDVGDWDAARRRDRPMALWHRRSIDWGDSKSHPFVCLWAFKDSLGNWGIYDEFFDDTAMLDDQRCDIIKNRWEWPEINAYHGTTFADPSRPGLINKFNSENIPTSGANNSVDNGIRYLQYLLRPSPRTGLPKIVIYKPNCPNLCRQMRSYRWLRSPGTGLNPHSPKNEPLKWQDDTCDAARYLCYSDANQTGAIPDSIAKNRDKSNRGILYGTGHG